MRSASANTDCSYDVRLARRWKRRASSSCSGNRVPKKEEEEEEEEEEEVVVDVKLNGCSKREAKKIVDNNNDDVFMEEEVADVDYERFLNGIRSFGDGEGNAEADYQKSLNGLRPYGEDGCVDNNDNGIGNENGDGDMDPQYIMFLDKLKEDGKSYVLEVSLNDGMSVVVKYEKEDGSCDVHKAADLGATERVLRSASKRMKIESLEVVSDILGKQKIQRTRTSRTVSRKESMETKKKTSRTVLRKESMATKKKTSRTVSRKESMETKKKMSDIRSRKRTSPMVEKKVEVASDPVSCQTNERSTNRLRPENSHSAKHKCNCEMKCDMEDKSYLEFLSCVKSDGKNMVFMPQSGKQVVYAEENVESASDPEVIVMDDDPFSCGNYTPFVASKSYVTMAEPERSRQSQFRENLMDILKKPYDNKEYDDLWNEVSCQKPKERFRDLRGGRERSCLLESPGKSYLDYHKDLGVKIKFAKGDRRKILNILRGFIYWLKNLTNEGAFHPWKDPLCLKVLPQF